MINSYLAAPNRVAFSIFGVDIMWYGIMIATGMMLALMLGYYRVKRHGLNEEYVIDIGLACLPFAIVGARLYYVIFSWDLYKDNLLQIFNLRAGGLAIHGGLIFGIGLGLYMMKRRKQNVIQWLDLSPPSIALGQAIGRWGNYFNGEAHGTPTDLPWAIEVDGVMVHPTFLYESLWCFFLCFFLWWYHDSGRRKFEGQTICLYLILYSIERFFVEGLRTDSLMIGPLRQAQVISVFLALLGVVCWVVFSKRDARMKAAAVETVCTEEIIGGIYAQESAECEQENSAAETAESICASETSGEIAASKIADQSSADE
ncbi:MAG: prolipoprotein diacylglyceryl transferase [Clostridiales bacterium]|nr:prolipoprotein diacylglyceryl transferase [Clostridiales bacterium]